MRANVGLCTRMFLLAAVTNLFEPVLPGVVEGGGAAHPSVHALREVVCDEIAPCWWPEVVGEESRRRGCLC